MEPLNKVLAGLEASNGELQWPGVAHLVKHVSLERTLTEEIKTYIKTKLKSELLIPTLNCMTILHTISWNADAAIRAHICSAGFFKRLEKAVVKPSNSAVGAAAHQLLVDWATAFGREDVGVKSRHVLQHNRGRSGGEGASPSDVAIAYLDEQRLGMPLIGFRRGIDFARLYAPDILGISLTPMSPLTSHRHRASMAQQSVAGSISGHTGSSGGEGHHQALARHPSDLAQVDTLIAAAQELPPSTVLDLVSTIIRTVHDLEDAGRACLAAAAPGAAASVQLHLDRGYLAACRCSTWRSKVQAMAMLVSNDSALSQLLAAADALNTTLARWEDCTSHRILQALYPAYPHPIRAAAAAPPQDILDSDPVPPRPSTSAPLKSPSIDSLLDITPSPTSPHAFDLLSSPPLPATYPTSLSSTSHSSISLPPTSSPPAPSSAFATTDPFFGQSPLLNPFAAPLPPTLIEEISLSSNNLPPSQHLLPVQHQGPPLALQAPSLSLQHSSISTPPTPQPLPSTTSLPHHIRTQNQPAPPVNPTPQSPKPIQPPVTSPTSPNQPPTPPSHPSTQSPLSRNSDGNPFRNPPAKPTSHPFAAYARELLPSRAPPPAPAPTLPSPNSTQPTPRPTLQPQPLLPHPSNPNLSRTPSLTSHASLPLPDTHSASSFNPFNLPTSLEAPPPAPLPSLSRTSDPSHTNPPASNFQTPSSSATPPSQPLPQTPPTPSAQPTPLQRLEALVASAPHPACLCPTCCALAGSPGRKLLDRVRHVLRSCQAEHAEELERLSAAHAAEMAALKAKAIQKMRQVLQSQTPSSTPPQTQHTGDSISSTGPPSALQPSPRDFLSPRSPTPSSPSAPPPDPILPSSGEAAMAAELEALRAERDALAHKVALLEAGARAGHQRQMLVEAGAGHQKRAALEAGAGSQRRALLEAGAGAGLQQGGAAEGAFLDYPLLMGYMLLNPSPAVGTS